jgi:hypothetical protein
MINKIKRLASSPVISSDQDIENFVRIMGLTDNSTNILKQTKEIIKTYYITGNIESKHEHIINSAISIIYQDQTKSNDKSRDIPTLSKGAVRIIEVANSENKTYFMIIAEIVDDYAEKKITNNDLKILSKKLQLNPLDIKTIYTYFYKDDTNVMQEVVKSKTLKDKNLTYLQKALLIAEEYHSGTMDDSRYKESIEVNHIDEEDMDSINNLLYTTEYINPSEEEILSLSKEYEEQDLYVDSNIPAKKRVNFKASSNYTITQKILILIDMTLFGSAKNALAVTTDGLYWHDDYVADDEGFISWQELFESDIKEWDEDYNTVSIGEKYTINVLGSDIGGELIIRYLKALQNLKKVEDSVATEIIEPDIDLKEAYKTPYKSMEDLIYKAFLYTTPTNSIIRYFAQYNINNVSDDDYDIIREHILKLSDKNKLEEIIVESEQNFLTFFESAVSSTRDDIVSIFERDIGEVFALNEQIMATLKQEIFSYRSILGTKMAEMQQASQQLKHYWSETEEGTGKMMTDALKGGSLGMIGASLFGPLGVAVAVGASYLNEKETEKKKDNLLQTLYDNWATTHDSFYFKQLKEYDERYKRVIENITKQFIDNYKQAYKIAIEIDKKSEYLNYFKKELKDMVTEKEFISMRREVTEHEAMFTTP